MDGFMSVGNKFLEVESRGIAFRCKEINWWKNYGEFPEHLKELEEESERWNAEIWDEYERFTWGRGAR